MAYLVELLACEGGFLLTALEFEFSLSALSPAFSSTTSTEAEVVLLCAVILCSLLRLPMLPVSDKLLLISLGGVDKPPLELLVDLLPLAFLSCSTWRWSWASHCYRLPTCV